MVGLAGWLLVGIAVMLWFKFLIHSGQISYTLWLGFRHILVGLQTHFGSCFGNIWYGEFGTFRCKGWGTSWCR